MTNTPATKTTKSTSKAVAKPRAKRAPSALAAERANSRRSTKPEPETSVDQLAAKRASKRTSKSTPVEPVVEPVVETPAAKRAPRFVAHVHPETYSASDALDVRSAQRHTSADLCELTMCTFSTLTDDAKRANVETFKQLEAERRAAERATISVENADQLAQLAELARASAERFEALVCELIDGGASPTHVGQACSLGNSAVRRIVMRRDAGRAAKMKS